MGSSERKSTIGKASTGSFSFLVRIFFLAFSIAGCQVFKSDLPVKPQFTSTAIQIPSTSKAVVESPIPLATISLTSSPALSPAPSPTPSPTASPILLLSEIHPEISYVSPITVQHITQDSVICSFELDHPSEGYLFYWRKGEAIQSQTGLALQEVSQQHTIKIEGLSPGVEYEIAVGLLDENGSYLPPGFLDFNWDPIRVRTLKEGKWPILVGVFGDSGFGGAVTYQLAERMATYDLDFVLHTGDIVYSVSENDSVQEAFALKYFQTLSPILKRFPLYPVPGNHEYYKDAEFENEPYYFHVFPPLTDLQDNPFHGLGDRNWYAVEIEPIQFLMLDTQLFWLGEGRADQTEWLMGKFNDDRFQVTIPVFHVPPFTSGIYPNDGKSVRIDWVPIFENNNVPLVLSGHDHNYQRLILDDITYIITGGGSAILYPMGIPLPQTQIFARRTHFVLLEFHPDHLSLTAITPEGEILDQAVIEYPERIVQPDRTWSR
jgi:hypothetical protein